MAAGGLNWLCPGPLGASRLRYARAVRGSDRATTDGCALGLEIA